VTSQQLNLLAVVGLAVCWGAFGLTCPWRPGFAFWDWRSCWLGSLLPAAGGRWIVSFPVFLVFTEFKVRIEERLMLAEFPDEYPRYRQRVPKLVPGLRLLGRRKVVSG
jgi:protein-S-isoprenylcysteine O-methyltransferase Ste14